jgi:septal ring factor EnvC (AmiA/AmiB activator)
MATEPDVTTMETIQRASESHGAKLSLKIAAVLFGIFSSVVLTSINNTLNDIRADQKTQTDSNVRQDQDIALMKVEISGLQEVTKATVASLQQIGNQVTHNADDISNLKTQQSLQVERSRPPR